MGFSASYLFLWVFLLVSYILLVFVAFPASFIDFTCFYGFSC